MKFGCQHDVYDRDQIISMLFKPSNLLSHTSGVCDGYFDGDATYHETAISRRIRFLKNILFFSFFVDMYR